MRSLQALSPFEVRGPFLERPGNLTGPKSCFEIKMSRNVGCVLTCNEAYFVSLADNFTVQFSNLLKLPSGMENKIAWLTGLVITESYEPQVAENAIV